MNELVSVQWLDENLRASDIVILDASMKPITEGTHSSKDMPTIPGARTFDIKGDFSDSSSDFPNTLPSEKQFELGCQRLGINQDSHIVVFDNLGIFASPRVWWMFKIMGHDKVSVLDGGLPEWISKNKSVEHAKARTYETGNFKADVQPEFVKGYAEILENVEQNFFNVIDARSNGRFNGTEKEPRKHLKSGHIPNSVNIPYSSVLNNGKYKSESELKELFEREELDNKDLVFSCGSGITACIVMLASELAYRKGKYIYDGSWSEWAERQNLKEDIE